MNKSVMKKIGVFFLILSLLPGMTDTGWIIQAEETNAIIVTPFAGQWKYYGQQRKFVQDVHYSVSNDEELPAGVSLAIESEETGKQAFVLRDEREADQKDPVYKLADKAPEYEIRAFHADAQADVPEEMVNLADRAELTDDKFVINAPVGYKISSAIGEDAVWGKEISVTLTEGTNTVTYYLASNQDNDTKKAIDQTPKTLTIKADWTSPVVNSVTGGDDSTDVSAGGQITGSESGKFYYVVLPKCVAEEEEAKAASGAAAGITTTYIQNRVTSHYGIVGYGRLDGTKATSFSFSGLTAETEYVIYTYIEDDAGNVSAVSKSVPFGTDRIALTGDVEIAGNVAVGQTLTAKPNLNSVDAGELSYQWYRITNKEDAASLDAVWDETGGAEEDDLEAEDDGEDEEDEEDEENEDDTYELDRVHKFAESEEEIIIDGDARLIKGADKSTYQVTKEDIGSRLICQVTAKNYSGYVAGESNTFVPKLIPELTLPVLSGAVYSPARKLSSITLPQRWSWVDNTIVPVYGNSGYRAKYIPEDTSVYRTVIVRIKVPVQKKFLTRKMIHLKKTYSYTGKAIKDNFSLEDGDETLESGKDYKATYRKNKKLGKAMVTIRGIGNYKGTKKVSYRIVKRSVKSLTCHYQGTKVYTGKPRTAGIVLKNGSVKLVKNRDYTVKYRNNIQIGKASAVIQGKGNYKGKRTIKFEIVPSKPKIVKMTKKKKSFRLQFSGKKQIKGYIVYVSTSSSFAKKKTQEYTTTGNRFGMQGLAKGTYYVRIKGYGVKKGKSYKSSYSKMRKIKIKK